MKKWLCFLGLAFFFGCLSMPDTQKKQSRRISEETVSLSLPKIPPSHWEDVEKKKGKPTILLIDTHLLHSPCHANVQKLQEAFLQNTLLPKESIWLLSTPKSTFSNIERLFAQGVERAASQGLLFVYFSGQAILGAKGDLFLDLPQEEIGPKG